MFEEQLKDIPTLLKYAIKSEEIGKKFYGYLAEKASNKEAKKRLENLRDDEARHENIFRDLYKKHVSKDIGELPEKGLDALASIFTKERLDKVNSEMEYISLAIEAEITTTRFYKEGVKVVEDKQFKDILHQLSEEENAHYEILMAEKEALAGNYFWFSADSTAPMED
jgi:rubrerythrin